MVLFVAAQLMDNGHLISADEGAVLSQVEILRSLGAGFIQGYHYARPMPEEAFVAWLRARQDAP